MINVCMVSPTHKGNGNCCFNSKATQWNKWIRKFKQFHWPQIHDKSVENAFTITEYDVSGN